MAQLERESKIIINVNTQRDGHIFALRPRSRVWLETEYPDRVRVPTVFIGLDKTLEFGQLPDVILSQVLTLLTGLSWEELESVGGFHLYDPITEKELSNPALAHV